MCVKRKVVCFDYEFLRFMIKLRFNFCDENSILFREGLFFLKCFSFLRERNYGIICLNDIFDKKELSKRIFQIKYLDV